MTVPDKDFFTTGEVARISGISPSTVRQCANDRKIKPFHIPGSSYRKFTRAALIQFLKDMGHEIEDQP